ncbi:MAG: DUF2142 domain-containing protein [Anaerolineae bacterium]
MHTHLSERTSRAVLVVVLAVYLILASLYAMLTPAWQVPDEPAHYNYVKHVAGSGDLPVLAPGDYPVEYLEEIKSRRFPPDMPIDGLRYEAHQPPLYYTLAAGWSLVADSVSGTAPLFGVRLFSVLIGAVALVLAYQVVHHVFPDSPAIALGAAAFAATLPMHLTMTAAVNSDVLAELLLALITLQVVRANTAEWIRRKALAVGLLLGLAFLTKMQAYVAFGLVFAALLWDTLDAHRQRRAGAWRLMLSTGFLIGGVALVVALPWLVRNALVYGWPDLLGLVRHDQVVTGQLTTRAYLEDHGALDLIGAFTQTTFQSFWGQFGWMGVVMDLRTYTALALVSALALAGVGRYLWGLARQPAGTSERTRRGVALLIVWVALTSLGYLWWNTRYLQHQGRYLFPAIVPLGAAFTVGLRDMLRGRLWLPLGVLGLALAGALGLCLVSGDTSIFIVALPIAAALVLLAGRWMEQRVPGLALGMAYLALAAFALYCLLHYIVPFLSP